VCVCVCVLSRTCLLSLTFMCTRTARGSHSLHAHTAATFSTHCTRFSNTVHYCTARSHTFTTHSPTLHAAVALCTHTARGHTFTTHSPHIHHTFTTHSPTLHATLVLCILTTLHTSTHTVRCSQTPNSTTHTRLAVTHSLALQTLSVPAASLLRQADDPILSCDPEPGLSCQVGVERNTRVMGLWWGQARSQQTFSRSAEHSIRITCVQAAHVCVCVCVCVCV
jgi:hypothetical protein